MVKHKVSSEELLRRVDTLKFIGDRIRITFYHGKPHFKESEDIEIDSNLKHHLYECGRKYLRQNSKWYTLNFRKVPENLQSHLEGITTQIISE